MVKLAESTRACIAGLCVAESTCPMCCGVNLACGTRPCVPHSMLRATFLPFVFQATRNSKNLLIAAETARRLRFSSKKLPRRLPNAHRSTLQREPCAPFNLGMGLCLEPLFLADGPEILTKRSWGDLEAIQFSRFRVWASVRVLRALKFVAEVC